MRLTTKGRFAVTAMIDMAINQVGGPVTLAGISQRQQISLSYLEQLFSKLRRHEILESIRGPGGGYVLVGRPEDVTVADIIIAVDEPIDATNCGSKGNCKKSQDGYPSHCMTHELWTTLNHKIIEYLDSVSLLDLVERESNKRKQSTALQNAAKTSAMSNNSRRIISRVPNSVFDIARST
ncbi:HTH-type transcriptional regulator IscR [Candidatus Pandoraea novymonadis]|uniref:HTH-type transcriptional regulator IscR n=1 Tax=Candidatus Pandoraea novymonadis TaxID=1808959 RepID=A0ABX5FED7_9BURK|nr:Fe-S cluster assembly transcription factor [Candidatus Pandoraea novymonadis]PSB92076.1 HTH-type transcriptional regulator IscR [Candidatus Pandoraea novymonadis]